MTKKTKSHALSELEVLMGMKYSLKKALKSLKKDIRKLLEKGK